MMSIPGKAHFGMARIASLPELCSRLPARERREVHTIYAGMAFRHWITRADNGVFIVEDYQKPDDRVLTGPQLVDSELGRAMQYGVFYLSTH